MLSDEGRALIVKIDSYVTLSDWERDTLILELGYAVTFDLYHHDQTMYGGWF